MQWLQESLVLREGLPDGTLEVDPQESLQEEVAVTFFLLLALLSTSCMC